MIVEFLWLNFYLVVIWEGYFLINDYFCGFLLDFMMDKMKKVRYVFFVFMVMLMVGIVEWIGEKEIIFLEMVVFVVGLWVIDKWVWKVGCW